MFASPCVVLWAYNDGLTFIPAMNVREKHSWEPDLSLWWCLWTVVVRAECVWEYGPLCNMTTLIRVLATCGGIRKSHLSLADMVPPGLREGHGAGRTSRASLSPSLFRTRPLNISWGMINRFIFYASSCPWLFWWKWSHPLTHQYHLFTSSFPSIIIHSRSPLQNKAFPNILHRSVWC